MSGNRTCFVLVRSYELPFYVCHNMKLCSVLKDVGRDSGVTGGGAGGKRAPQRLLTGKFVLTYREKKRQGQNGKGVTIEKKRRKIVKGKVENWKWK